MSRMKDRDSLIAQLSRELPATSVYQITDLARKLMRAGSTLQRLAEAQCNGDWPADNGERKVVYCGGAEQEGCGSMWAPSVLKGKGQRCPDCRTQANVSKLCAEYGVEAMFNGDPRGAVFLVIPPSYAERNANRDSFDREGIYVS